MRFKESSDLSYLLLFVIALICIGGSMSIGNYGVYLPIFLLVSIMFLWNLIKKRKNYLPTTLISIYAFYVLIFWVCTLFNGDDDLQRVSLTINYAISIIIYVLLSQQVKTVKSINQIINLLIFILFVNCIITLAQYYNVTASWGIWYLLNDVETIKQSQLIEKMATGSQEVGQGYLFCPGIFPTQVYNGYIVSSLGIFTLYKSIRSAKLLPRIYYYMVLAIVVYSLFVIQQRAAFILFIGACSVVFYSRYKLLTILLLISFILVFCFSNYEVSEDKIGRFANMEDETRERLYATGIDYILNHMVFGGRKNYVNINNLSVHNIFLNAFLYGGILGAILIIAIYCKMIFSSVKIILKNIYQQITPTTAFAYALLIYNLISLTHNNSLLTGDPLIWILYALMLISVKRYNVSK